MEREVEPLEQWRVVAVRVTDALQVDDLVAQPGDVDVQVQVVVSSGLLLLHRGDLGGRADAGLGLAGPGRGTPPQPGQLTAGQVLADRLGLGGVFFALGLALEVPLVAAVVQVGRTPLQLQHAVGDPIEHVAVVGDDHDGTPERRQPVLQPGDGVDVQVVGGLVQQEQIALGQQRPGQRRALGLAPGQLGDRGVEHRSPCPAGPAPTRPPTPRRPPRGRCRSPGAGAGPARPPACHGPGGRCRTRGRGCRPGCAAASTCPCR